MPAVEYLHEVDPKQALTEKLGDLSGVEVFGSDCLVALYSPPEKTKSGLIISETQETNFAFRAKLVF